MSICPRVGGVAYYLDKARMTPAYDRWNKRVKRRPAVDPAASGDQAEKWLQQFKDAIKASFHGGMLFEELGFAYLGPIDGHDLKTLRKYLKKVKAMDGPVLLHVLTDKGRGFEPADEGPGQVPRPRPVRVGRERDHPADDVVEQGLHRRRQRRALLGRWSATRRSPC